MSRRLCPITRKCIVICKGAMAEISASCVTDARDREWDELTPMPMLEWLSRRSTERIPVDRQRYVVSIRSTGLGDRLASLAAAWSFAKSTARTLVVDWRFGGISADGQNAFAQCFEPTPELASVPFIADRHMPAATLPSPRYPAIWNKDELLDFPFFRPSGALTDQRRAVRLIRSQKDIPARTVVFDGCIADGAPDLTRLRQFYSALSPTSSIASQVAEFRRCRIPAPCIGLHIRNGNGGDIMGHRRHWDSTEKALQRCIAAVRHAQELLGSDVALFLATDSAMIERGIRSLLPDVISREKDYRPEGAGELHLDTNAWRHRSSAMIDMLLLAQCSVLIRYPPASFFSLYAAVMLSEGSNDRTVYDLLRPWNGDPLSPSIVFGAP